MSYLRAQAREKRVKDIARRKANKGKLHVPPHNAGADDAAPIDTADGAPAIPKPKSMVFRRGQVAPSVLQLITDLRLVMSPDTAVRLKERQQNTMKDFLSVGPQLGVTHFMCLTQSDVGINLRIIRVPHGPTLTFRVTNFSLMRDVAHASKRPHSPGHEMKYSPLIVLNQFNAPLPTSQPPSSSSSPQPHLHLTSTVLQSMFAPLHLPSLTLSHCRRVVLFNYDPVSKAIEMRHYLITAAPTGITNKAIKKLVKGELLDLGHLTDMDQFFDSGDRGGGVATSDSEMEGDDNKVTLADRYIGRGNREHEKSAIRLKEIGPRLSLLLMKIEDGFCNGQVLYHHYMTKSDDEMKAIRAVKEQRKREREQRRREQERRVREKAGDAIDSDEADDGEEENEDERWYEEEVGEKPDPSVFARGINTNPKRSRDNDDANDNTDRQSRSAHPLKRRKLEARGRQSGRGASDEADDDAKRKRAGGRRVGAGPRKPWVRGRGGGGGAGRGGGGGGGRSSGGGRGGGRGRCGSSRGRGR